MSVTVERGRIFAVTIETNDQRIAALSKPDELAQQSMRTGAVYWHTGILPEHFKPGADGRYGYAPRSPTYLRDPRKSGKPPLELSGSLRRDLAANASLNVAGGSVSVSMHANVLNLAPPIPDDSEALYVKHRSARRGYPNLKREIKAITLPEEKAIAEVVARDLAARLDPEASSKTEARL